MIEVTVHEGKINVSGHANFAQIGKDIVCAGVSVLAQTLIKSIEDLTEDKIKYSMSPGRVDIEYEDLSEKSRTLVDSFLIGINAIADEYPDYVRITRMCNGLGFPKNELGHDEMEETNDENYR